MTTTVTTETSRAPGNRATPRPRSSRHAPEWRGGPDARKPRSTTRLTWASVGALGGIRTPNLLIRSQMLYPLSYERKSAFDLRL